MISATAGSNPYLSLIVPLYQEQDRVLPCVRALDRFVPGLPFDCEIIFVDDGSTDGTLDALRSAGPQSPHRLVAYAPNRGKGHAIHYGMGEARGAYRLFLDVDLSTPLDQLYKFLPLMARGRHVMIGTRKAPGAAVVRQQRALRRRLGESFTTLASFLTAGGITDFTCGFKCFSSEAADAIFSIQRIDGWAFDAEILFLACKYGYAIDEIPVVWANDAESRVRLVPDALWSLRDLARVRVNDLLGRYGAGRNRAQARDELGEADTGR